MLGVEGTAEGISVRPRLPFGRWSWSGSGLSLSYDKTRIHGSISAVGPEVITLELQLPGDWQGGPVEIEEGGAKRKVEHAGPLARLSVWVGPHTTTEFAVNRA